MKTRLIVHKSREKSKGKVGINAWAAITLVLCLSIVGSLEVKHWEYYSDVSGTIRRVAEEKRSRSMWLRITALALLNAMLYFTDLWGAPVLWGVAIWFGRRPLLETLTMGTHKKILVVLGLLVIFSPSANASCAAALPQVVSAGKDVLCAAAVSSAFFEVKLGNGYRLTLEKQRLIHEVLRGNPQIATREILAITCIRVSISQVNRLRKKWGFSRKPGRPSSAESPCGQLVTRGGLKLFYLWLENGDKYQHSLESLYEAIEFHYNENPEDDFRILYSRKETIARKWKVLTLLSLAGIKRLSQVDYCPHDLWQTLGYSYRYATLKQFVQDLEKIDAGCFLREALSKGASGQFCYIDPHLFPYWTRRKMNKGLITSKGKIMAGSKMILAHDQQAQAIDLEFHPPDIHLNNVIEAMCANIFELTGIKNFVIDREVNAVEIARMFKRNGWELICMLASNEYKGPESFKKRFCKRLDDGTTLYKATWQPHKKDDPREFVLVKKPDELLVYWGTPKIVRRLTAEKLVSVYHQRTEIQENSIKDMIAHCALNINYGRKVVPTIKRSHQRKIAELSDKIQQEGEKIVTVNDKIKQQFDKISRSLARNRLDLVGKQNEKLKQFLAGRRTHEKQIEEFRREKEELGPAPPRSDRDFRKQEVMGYRSLWLENQIKLFVKALALPEPIDEQTLIELFFDRSAALLDDGRETRVLFDTKGLSLKYRRVLNDIIASCNRIFQEFGGNKVSVKVAGFT